MDILSANFPEDFDGFLKISFSMNFCYDADFVIQDGVCTFYRYRNELIRNMATRPEENTDEAVARR